MTTEATNQKPIEYSLDEMPEDEGGYVTIPDGSYKCVLTNVKVMEFPNPRAGQEKTNGGIEAETYKSLRWEFTPVDHPDAVISYLCGIAYRSSKETKMKGIVKACYGGILPAGIFATRESVLAGIKALIGKSFLVQNEQEKGKTDGVSYNEWKGCKPLEEKLEIAQQEELIDLTEDDDDDINFG